MPLYTETGAINVVSNDTTKGRYSPTGALRINLVSGASYTGLYAADGALNVIDVSGISISTYGGLYHPCGALRGRTAPDTLSGLQAPDGSYYLRGLFSPLNLFSNGEPGGWYDPSDLTTMFQDAAGTTAAALESPVGLVLDKSKGLVLGSELVTNGTFDGNSSSGWTLPANVTVANNRLEATLAAMNSLTSGTLNVSTTVGKSYRVEFDVISSSGAVRTYFSGTFFDLTNFSGRQSRVLVASSSSDAITFQPRDGTASFTIDNISVRELPGSHLSQSTSTARPVLSARVNLLTRTEEFDNAAWVKANGGVGSVGSVTPNAGTDPLGGNTADRLQVTLNGGTASADISRIYQSNATTGALIFSIYVRSYDGTSTYIMSVTTAGGTNSITVTPAWQRVEISATSSGAVFYGIGLRGAQTPANSDSADILIWGADLRPSNAGVGLPSYQRVGAATSGSSTAAGNADYDTTGFPLYLKFDGTDDFLVSSGSIDFTSTDKMSVFAGLRKLSDASMFLAETTASIGSNNGAVAVYIDDPSYMYDYVSKGTTQVDVITTATGFAAPHTAVLTGLSDIIADRATLRINGSQVAEVLTDQGTGNYANAPLYVGSRGGVAARFNGNLYSFIIRGALSTDAQIASTETWVNSKTRAY